MRAVCWEGKEKIHVETVLDPVILNPRDANVKVTTTAICGSDLQHLRWVHSDDADGPHCKPTLALGESDQLLEVCGIKTTLPSDETDTGVLVASRRHR